MEHQNYLSDGCVHKRLKPIKKIMFSFWSRVRQRGAMCACMLSWRSFFSTTQKFTSTIYWTSNLFSFTAHHTIITYWAIGFPISARLHGPFIHVPLFLFSLCWIIKFFQLTAVGDFLRIRYFVLSVVIVLHDCRWGCVCNIEKLPMYKYII